VIRKLFGSGTPARLPAPAEQLVIIDGPSVYGMRQNRLGYKEQLAILGKLSTIQKNEGWNIEIVFEGEPLRKVASGEKFDDVTVHFAPHAEHFLDVVVERAKLGKKRKTVTVVTSDKDLTDRIGDLGITLMRSTCFRKAFDKGGRSGDGGGGSSSGRRRRRGGSGRGKKDGGNRKEAPVKPRDAVSDLIDLVE